MTRQPLPHAFAGSWGKLEEIVESFEEAWLQGQRPSIDEYLRDGDLERATLVIELAHTELECRLKAGEPVRVETYLERYPEIAADRQRCLALVAAEYRLRRRREPVTPDEYAARFPQLGDELRSRLIEESGPTGLTLRGLSCPRCRHAIAASMPAAAQELTCPSCGFTCRLDPAHRMPESLQRPTRLGKFELQEVVGRGAFGVVYRARDTELDRIVAVKLPRNDWWADRADEERFVREARHAARLSHPGIVPVYEVGRSESWPYLVSAFVEGRTLADILTERRLGFHESAEVLAQVAEALDHAHGHGVVHRDLKPSNILLGRLAGADTPRGMEPRAFVTDFGLARRAEAEVVLTVEGQVLGTPAYMSPEQARGQGHKVDGRSDVYSLGVILYELLTGELPFRGTARMVLHQILYDDPRPPRQLNDKVPRDLETITQKCLAKEPARRYASAGELAADLRRWLAGEPIRARPVGRLEKGWRWACRNPRLAGLSAAVALLLLAVAVGSTTAAIIISRQKDKIAEEEQFATRQLEVTLDTLDDLVKKAEALLADDTGYHPLKQEMLNTALAGLNRVAESQRGADAARESIATTHRLRGQIFLMLGRTEEARGEFERYREVAEVLATENPRGVAGRRNQFRARLALGDISLRQGDTAAARESYAAALALADTLAADYPDDTVLRRDRVIAHNRLGLACLRAGEVRLAGEEFRRSLDLLGEAAATDTLEAQRDRAHAHDLLGDVSLKLGDLTAAQEHYNRAQDLLVKLETDNPQSIEVRRELSIAYEKLGDLSVARKQPAEARLHYEKALKRREELAAADPLSARARRDLAVAYEKVGNVAWQLKDAIKAEEYHGQALRRREELAAADPKDARARRDLSVSCERLGDVCRLLGRPADALAYYRRALGLREALAAEDRDGAEAQADLIVAHGNLGLGEIAARDYEAALAQFQRGLALLDELEKQGKTKDQPQYQEWRQRFRQRLEVCQGAVQAADDLDFVLGQPAAKQPGLLLARAAVLAKRGRLDDAVAAAERLRALGADKPDVLLSVASCYAFCAAAAEPPARQRYTTEALQAVTAAVRHGYKDAARLETNPDLAVLRKEEEFRRLVEGLKAGGL